MGLGFAPITLGCLDGDHHTGGQRALRANGTGLRLRCPHSRASECVRGKWDFVVVVVVMVMAVCVCVCVCFGGVGGHLGRVFPLFRWGSAICPISHLSLGSAGACGSARPGGRALRYRLRNSGSACVLGCRTNTSASDGNIGSSSSSGSGGGGGGSSSTSTSTSTTGSSEQWRSRKFRLGRTENRDRAQNRNRRETTTAQRKMVAEVELRAWSASQPSLLDSPAA